MGKVTKYLSTKVLHCLIYTGALLRVQGPPPQKLLEMRWYCFGRGRLITPFADSVIGTECLGVL